MDLCTHQTVPNNQKNALRENEPNPGHFHEGANLDKVEQGAKRLPP